MSKSSLTVNRQSGPSRSPLVPPWLVLLPAILLLAVLAAPASGQAACSPYLGRAVINEVRSGPLTFLEVKVLDPTIDLSVIHTWSLRLCNSREGCSGPHSLATFTDSYPYFTTDVVPERYVELSTTGARSGTDLLLTDAAGDAIDYLSIAGFTLQQVACGYLFDTVFPGSNSFEAARIPDGTGDWSDLDSGGNSVPPTEGDTNDDPTGTLPRLQLAGDTVPEGGTADFAVTLVDANGNPVTAAQDITVEYATVDDTATAAEGDYTPASGVFTIAAGTAGGTIPVATLADAVDDDGERFFLFLSNPAGASIVNHYAAATISGTLPALDHFRIQNPGTALTCQPAAVIVTACQNADCSLTYDDALEIDLSPSGWVGGDSRILSGGSATFYLRRTTPGSVILGIAGSDPAAANPAVCYQGGSPGSCGLEFFDSGFVFDVPDLISCEGSGNVVVSAVRKDDATQACVAAGGFANRTAAVGFWSSYLNPGSGSTPLLVNGSPVVGAFPGSPVTLSFDANARAAIAVRYHDAGRLRLDARYVGTGEEAGLVMSGTDTFAVSPDHLEVVATTDGTTLLDNAADSGLPRLAAGAPFQVDVTARCQDGTVTPNFAWDTLVSAAAPFAPAGGTLGSLANGSFVAGDFAGGTATTTTAHYSEVGTVTLQAEARDYLQPGNDISGSSTMVGRFTPDRFTVSTNVPRFRTGCAVGSFTYLGEFFDYETRPVLTVTAENRQGDTTLNYTDVFGGDWFKITNATLAGKSYLAETGTLDTSRLPVPDPVISDLGNGTADLTFDTGSPAAGEGIAFLRGDPPVAAFAAEIGLEIDVLDGDGVAYGGNPARFGDPSAGNGILFDNGKEMRWGRLVLYNAFGPEILPLDVPLQTEYFADAASGFVRNAADACTLVTEADLTLRSAVDGPQAGNLPLVVRGTGTTSAGIANQPLANGDAGLVLAAPGEGGDGWVDLTVDLSTATGLDRPWLRYDWNGDGAHDDDPSARATFGIYRGHPGRIYLRETYR